MTRISSNKCMLLYVLCASVFPRFSSYAASPEVETSAAQERVFRAALAAVSPVVVRIDTIGGAQLVECTDEPDAPSLAAPVFRQADGPTSGVIVSPDGFVLTSSFNFVRDPAVITIALHDGRRFVARLVARDRPARLALLKIDAADLPTPEWADPAGLRPGQWALLVGYGHSTPTPALSVGTLSAVSRLEGRAVQTDARTSPANYGGPLFDVRGRIIGLCVPQAGRGDDEVAGVQWYDSGIGFAVRSDFLRERLPRLMRGETLQTGVLGLLLDPAPPLMDADWRAASTQPLVLDGAEPPATRSTSTGVRVAGLPSGPAQRAGLQTGDIIMRINDLPTPTFTQLRRVLARSAAGDEIRVHYLRDGREHEVTIALEAE